MESAHCWQSAACRKVRAGLEAVNPGIANAAGQSASMERHAAGGAGGANPLVLRGARTIRTLSARYIADLQDHWEIHGKEALDEESPDSMLS
jgi:hypothetical protein